MKLIYVRTGLGVGTGGTSASGDELPHQGLRCQPDFIIAPGQIAFIALIVIQKGKPHGFFWFEERAFQVADEFSFS